MRFLFFFFFLALFLTSCIDPTSPEFQLEDSFYLVEGRVLAGEEGSEVRVRESAFTEANQTFEPIENAQVMMIGADGRAVSWEPFPGEPGTYRLPEGNAVQPGESWKINVVMPDGTTVESSAETVPDYPTVNGLDVVFEQNSIFDAARNRFLPRFELFINYEEPVGRGDFYRFDYRFWEEVIICISCPRGRYNGVECIEDPFVMPRFDYYCDTDECYLETAGNNAIFSTDEFTDGQSVTGFPIGGINFEAFGGLLVEGTVQSVSPEAFEYGKVIQDLTTGNAGLNATTPAALDGNMRNLDPAGRTVLGFFGAAASRSARVYLERNEDTGTPLPFDDRIYPEPLMGAFVPPRAPCVVGDRTDIRPEGWGE